MERERERENEGEKERKRERENQRESLRAQELQKSVEEETPQLQQA